MKRLRNSFLLVMALTHLCCLAAPAANESSNDIDAILKLFPGYHVLTLAERDAETQAFIHQHLPKQNPSIVHTDLDSDRHLDYALLLKQDKSQTAKLVVLLCPADCEKTYELDITGYAALTYLRPVPIGSRVSQTDAIDTKNYPSPATPRPHGIEVTYFEKAKMVYYWNKKQKRIEAVQTGD
jgi:hypothetical protein